MVVEKQDRMLGGLWGAIVGDALGVPVEFTSRAERQRDPVTDMRGYRHGSDGECYFAFHGGCIESTRNAWPEGLVFADINLTAWQNT